MIDTQAGDDKVLIEEKLKKATAEKVAPADEPFTPQRQTGSQDMGGTGAAAAAGVLTAVDEDEEGGEEAVVPKDFEYFSDNEEDL